MGTTESGRFLVTWSRPTVAADPQVDVFRAGMAGHLALSLPQAASLVEQLHTVLWDVWLRTDDSPRLDGGHADWLADLRKAAGETS